MWVTSEVRNQSLTSIDLTRGSVGASELRSGSVQPWDLNPDFRADVEEAVADGNQGEKGEKGEPGIDGYEVDGVYTNWPLAGRSRASTMAPRT